MRTWEVTHPIPNWLLEFFHIPCGFITIVEVYISVYEPDEQDNHFCLEISFTQNSSTLLPHQVEPSWLTIIYSWLNWFYQGEPERAASTPSWVSLASEITLAEEDSAASNSLVPVIDWPQSGLVWVQALFSWTWTLTIGFGPADWWSQTQNLLNWVQ